MAYGLKRLLQLVIQRVIVIMTSGAYCWKVANINGTLIVALEANFVTHCYGVPYSHGNVYRNIIEGEITVRKGRGKRSEKVERG